MRPEFINPESLNSLNLSCAIKKGDEVEFPSEPKIIRVLSDYQERNYEYYMMARCNGELIWFPLTPSNCILALSGQTIKVK